MKIQIRFAPLPEGIHGAVLRDLGNQFWLACNSTDPVQIRRFAYGHELAHIFCGHLAEETFDVPTGEVEANRKAWRYYRRFRNQFIQAESTGKATLII